MLHFQRLHYKDYLHIRGHRKGFQNTHAKINGLEEYRYKILNRLINIWRAPHGVKTLITSISQLKSGISYFISSSWSATLTSIKIFKIYFNDIHIYTHIYRYIYILIYVYICIYELVIFFNMLISSVSCAIIIHYSRYNKMVYIIFNI